MAKNKPIKIVSKKHLARLERERRQTRAITLSAIAIIVAIILLITYGILNQTLLFGVKPAAIVNGEKVSMREFQMRLRVWRQQLIDQYVQYYQLYVSFGMDPSSDSTLLQVQQELDSSNATTLGGRVLDNLIDELLIRQYAQKNGISVSEEEAQGALQDAFGYFPNGTLTPTTTLTPFAYSTLSNLQLTLMTTTPTFTPTITSTAGPTLTPTIIPTAGPTLTPVVQTPYPTETPISEDSYLKQYQGTVNHFKKVGMSEIEFRQVFFENTLYRDRVKAQVTADVPHETEQVWVRDILVADEDTAKSIYAKLIGGADFATLASQDSLDTSSKDQGGDLGWFGRGVKTTDFENAAFALNIGEISQPVQDSNGWHVFQVLGHEVRPLTDTEYQNAVDTAFNTWLTQQRDASTVVTASNWADYAVDTPTLQDGINNFYATYTAMAPTNLAKQQTLDALNATPTETPTP